MKPLKEYWKILGPGLTTGAADDDPSGIATYSQLGAARGTGLIWLSWFTYPLMSVVQEMCARIGLVTGQGLAANVKKHFSKKILLVLAGLLLIANTFNIGANLGAMAESTRLLLPGLNFYFLVVAFALGSLLAQIFISYRRYAKFLKYLSLILFAYILSALLIKLDWSLVLRHTFLPAIHFGREEIILICAALGTTISPYLFFWQTSQEVEEKISEGQNSPVPVVAQADIKKMRVDVWSGMFLSNLVMFFIIAASAGTLFTNGITEIASAAQAAEALRPFAGDLSYLLFTVGILGTGLLSIPVLAGSVSYAVSETFGWREGLFRKLKGAWAFYGVLSIAMILGIVLNFAGLNPIRALIFAAVLNGIVAPVILFFIVRLAGDRQVMGLHKNGTLSSFFGWLTVAVMAVASTLTIIFLLF